MVSYPCFSSRSLCTSQGNNLKKIEKHLGEHLKLVKLYYDDLLEIYEYELESIEEILSIKKPFITNLSIMLYEPVVSVGFKNSSIWLYASDDTPLQRGLYEKIKTILVKRQRLFAPFFQSSIASGVFTGTSTWWLFTDTYKYVGIIIFCLGLLWMYFGHKSQFHYYSLIVPLHRTDKPSFFERNKDQLFLALISAIIGGIITLGISKLS